LTPPTGTNKLFNVASNIAEASLPIPAVSEPIENTAPSTAGMTTKVVKGSLWTLAGQVAPMAVSFFTTPFVIRLLGSEGYGILILITLIPTYFSFADFGMGLASTKFASEAYAEGKFEKEARIVRTAAMIGLASSAPVATLIIIFAGYIIGLFNVSPNYVAEATLALHLSALTFVINLLCSIFNSHQLARLRMDLNTAINAVPRILGLIATPVIIYFGYGIVGAVTVLLVASLFNLFGHIIISGRLSPNLFGITIDRCVAKRMVGFGGSLVLVALAGIILVHAEKGILASAVSASALAHYSVAYTLASMITLFSSAMIQSLIPAFSQLQTEERRSQLNSIYSRGIRFSIIWMVPALVVLTLSAKPFFTLWAGPEYGQASTIPFYVLISGLAFNIVAYLPYSAILSAGRSDLLAKIYWLEVIPYIAIVWFSASRYGAVGAAAAWSIRVIGDAVIQFIIAKRFAGIRLVPNGWKGLAVSSLVMLVPLVVFAVPAISTLLVVSIVLFSVIVYTVLIWKFVLSSEESDWLMKRAKLRLVGHIAL